MARYSAGGVCMAESMHRESLDPGLIAKFIEVGVIAAVLGRLPGAPVDEDQVRQPQLFLLAGLAIHIGQSGVELVGLLSLLPEGAGFSDILACAMPTAPRVHPVTVDNYDPELVLNPDDAKETSLAVYADNEIIIGSSEPALRLLCGS